MGKYMRKRSVGRRTTPAVELGVRTRARSAAVASAAAAAAVAEAETAVRGKVQLRSRSLFIVPAGEGEVQCPVPPSPAAAVQRSSGASGEPPVEEGGAGNSRCSSTASSVDVAVLAVVSPGRKTTGGEANEAPREDRGVDSAVSDSAAGCRRERRETTPSSRPPADLPHDEEWSQATDDGNPTRHRRPTAFPTTATTAVARRRRARMMPPAEEIEEFFAAAEKAQAELFAAKYNFDVVRGLPLGAGRYEWTPVASG